MTGIVLCTNKKEKYCQRILSSELRTSKRLARNLVHRQDQVQEVVSN